MSETVTKSDMAAYLNSLSGVLSRDAVEAKVRGFLAHDYCDAAGRAAFFAEDGRFEDPVGAPALEGRAAIQERLTLTIGQGWFSAIKPDILSIAGDEAAVALTADVSQNGVPAATTRVLMTFSLDPAANFHEVRAFIGGEF